MCVCVGGGGGWHFWMCGQWWISKKKIKTMRKKRDPLYFNSTILSGIVHVKDALLLIRNSIPRKAAAGFLSIYLNGPLPYVRRHIIVNKMC